MDDIQFTEEAFDELLKRYSEIQTIFPQIPEDTAMLFAGNNFSNKEIDELLRSEAIDVEDNFNEATTEDDLIVKFNELIESDECSQLKYECLIDPLTKIIENESVLKQMREENPLGFDDVYHTHFIEKKNTFRLVQEPIISMAMVFVMRRWH